MSINFGSLGQFISHLSTLSSPEKQQMLAQALNSDRLDLVRDAINNTSVHSPEIRNLALRASIETGKINFALDILDRFKSLNPEERKIDLFLAAERGLYPIVQALLAGDAQISEKDRGIAVVIAANNGFLGVIQTLLANGPISEEDRALAFSNASSRGFNDVVILLLSTGFINDSHLGDALMMAAGLGHWEVIAAILAVNRVIPNVFRVGAIGIAGNNGNLDIVNLLLAYAPISDLERGEAVTAAALGGRLEIVQAILATGLISNEHRGQAINSAVIGNSLPVVQALINSGPIYDQARLEAIALARALDRPIFIPALEEAHVIIVPGAAGINPAQSTHTTSVHKSVFESAQRLSEKFRAEIDSGIEAPLRALRQAIKESDHPHKAFALRALDRITHPDYVFNDTTSGVSIQELLAIAVLSHCPLDVIIQGLYENQREYNLDDHGHDNGEEDLPSCASGTFNKIMQIMQMGGVEGSEIVYITKETATLKLQACVKDYCKIKGIEEITDGNFEAIKAAIRDEMIPFRPVFRSDDEFEAFLDSAQWVDISKPSL